MRFKRDLSRFYTDRAIVFRHESIKVKHETVMQLQKLHDGLPCRISQTGLAKNNQTVSKNPIVYSAKLFCDAEIDIRQGDEIEVTRNGQTRRYIAGEPFPYSSHLEIDLSRKGDA